MDLLSLWLPILLSAVAVWFVSTLFGMPFLHHKDDWVGLPGAVVHGDRCRGGRLR